MCVSVFFVVCLGVCGLFCFVLFCFFFSPFSSDWRLKILLPRKQAPLFSCEIQPQLVHILQHFHCVPALTSFGKHLVPMGLFVRRVCGSGGDLQAVVPFGEVKDMVLLAGIPLLVATPGFPSFADLSAQDVTSNSTSIPKSLFLCPPLVSLCLSLCVRYGFIKVRSYNCRIV